MSNVKDKILDIIEFRLRSKFNLKERLTKDLGFDELDIIEFIIELEETFDIVISQEDELNFVDYTAEDVINYINKELLKGDNQ